MKIFRFVLPCLVFASLVLACKEDPINLPAKADFDYAPKDSILTTDTVKFTNKSTPQERIIEYNWDFDGDGKIDSKEKNPRFVFNKAGRYTIILTIKGNKGDLSLKSTAINVRRPANGKLTVFRRSKLNGLVRIELDTTKRTDSLFFPTPPSCSSTTGKAMTFTLKEGQYNLTATYANTGAKWTRKIDIIGGECNLQEYSFVINTQLEVSVKDTANKVANLAAVQLFLTYKDWQNRTNPATPLQNTNTEGKVVFDNLALRTKYWIRASKSTFVSDSTAVSSLTEGVLNTVEVKFKR
jgi:PKD repeat protein